MIVSQEENTIEPYLWPLTEKEEIIHKIIESVITQQNCELVYLKLVQGKKHDILKLFFDMLDGSNINIATLESLNRLISSTLDVEDEELKIFNKSYSLEVSSPGLDRPITKTSHFHRAVGELIKVKISKSGLGKPGSFQGILVKVNDDNFELLVNDKENITFNFNEIVSAKKVFVFEHKNKKNK